jgi:hypothetical protein
MNRKMTTFEKFHTDRLIGTGCAICSRPSNWHHFIHGLKGLRITTEHLFGMPLCEKHHQNGPDALHEAADENRWCEDHGVDKNFYIGEVAVSLALWCSGKPRLRLV